MSEWTEAVEAKARIIHGQLAAACVLAERNGASPDDIAQPYLELLRSLYRDEFAFAQLVDTSDLVARFVGPAVSGSDPTVTTVTGVFNTLRNQIRQIAKSIVGLSSDERVAWPSDLDPHLSGMTHGSLVVGISIHSPDEDVEKGQTAIPGVSQEVFESVRGAVRSIATVAHHVHGDRVDEPAIESSFPDPAVRDTVMVAASKLAPTGRKGIEGVAFYGSEETGVEAPLLTARSRKMLNQALGSPIRVTGQGSFEGVVRAIDLDARRFHIREVEHIGGLRCMYGPGEHETAKTALDRRVRVSGNYEVTENQKPRLIAVTSIELLDDPARQFDMSF